VRDAVRAGLDASSEPGAKLPIGCDESLHNRRDHTDIQTAGADDEAGLRWCRKVEGRQRESGPGSLARLLGQRTPSAGAGLPRSPNVWNSVGAFGNTVNSSAPRSMTSATNSPAAFGRCGASCEYGSQWPPSMNSAITGCMLIGGK
jgi:hypothetical protein